MLHLRSCVLVVAVRLAWPAATAGGMDAQAIAKQRSLAQGGAKPIDDVIREKLGDQGADPDLERFMNGAISADELQMRRAEAVMRGEAEFNVGGGAKGGSDATFDDGFDPDAVDSYADDY